MDFFAAFQIDTGSLAASFAIGLQVVAPTASVDRLGNQQWQLGVANVYFNATSPMFQYGYLLIYRAGGGDTNGRSRVNQGALQTFAYYQLGDGWYTGGAPIWCYNFNNDSYSIPL